MNKPRTNIAALLALLLAVTTVVANFSAAYAATLTTASLSLTDPRPSVASTYDFQASGVTLTAIKCIKLVFSTTATGTTKPTSMVTNTAGTLSGNYVPTPTSWTKDVATDGTVKYTLSGGETPASASSRTISITGMTNGNTANTSYYLQMSTYNNTDCSTSPVDAVTVQFVYTDGQSVTASIDPTLIFAVNGVTGNGSLTVNGNTISNGLATTTSTIPFGTLSTGSNKIAAQDVSVTTNAGSGYTVYIRYTGPLSAGAGRDLADLSGAPNSTPITFPSSTEAFGYTTEDAVLGTGTTGRFSGNKWAAFTTSPQEVAFKATGGAIDTNRIGFQTGITGTTKPGAYSTTVIYTATPIY